MQRSSGGALPDGKEESLHKEVISSAFTAELVANLQRRAKEEREAGGVLGAGDDVLVLGDEHAPIFVVGAYRSGSTLIEQILSSHSKVHGAGENTALSPTVGAVSEEAGGFPSGLLLAAHKDPLLLQRAGARYMRTMRAHPPLVKSQKPRWVDKNLGNSRLVGLILLMLPSAKVVHTVRSAVATAFSMYSQHFTQGSPAGRWFTTRQEFLVHHHRMHTELMRHWDATLPQDRMITVRYEDLVEGQENVTRGLLAFLGLDWEDACLDFHKTDRSVSTASMSQVRRPMYNSSVAGWRRYERQLKTLVDGLGDIDAIRWRTAPAS